MSVSENNRLKKASIVLIVINTLLVFILYGMPKFGHHNDIWIMPHFADYVVQRDLEITQYSHIVDGNEVSTNGDPLIINRGAIVGGYATIDAYPFTVKFSVGENDYYNFDVNEGDIVMSDEYRTMYEEYAEHNRMVTEEAQSHGMRHWLRSLNLSDFLITGAIPAVLYALVAFLFIHRKNKKRVPTKKYYIAFVVINSILSVIFVVSIVYWYLNPIPCR